MLRNNSQRKLDNHLVLHGWLNSHFGYKTTRDLLNDVKNVDEGFNPDGYSPICQFLISRAEPNSAIERELRTYDDNIKRHLSSINDKRTQPIVLRYFQYLRLALHRNFLGLEDSIDPPNSCDNSTPLSKPVMMPKHPVTRMDSDFTETDIEKLAFWMATGAGKTLIMHINYHQFLHYNKEALDHIVLITPNEGLSEQHIHELSNSDIRCERFNVEGNSSPHAKNAVQVIEITKLVEEKIGEGESVEVEAFEGKNLILWTKDIKAAEGKSGANSR